MSRHCHPHMSSRAGKGDEYFDSEHTNQLYVSSHSVPSTPGSPISAFSHPQHRVYAVKADGHTQQSGSDESEEDAAAIRRVLTPQEDPFAQAEIVVSLLGTPRPHRPPLSRAASPQHSPPRLDMSTVRTAERQGKKTSPATPVSAAYTLPSSRTTLPRNTRLTPRSTRNPRLLLRSGMVRPPLGPLSHLLRLLAIATLAD